MCASSAGSGDRRRRALPSRRMTSRTRLVAMESSVPPESRGADRRGPRAGPERSLVLLLLALLHLALELLHHVRVAERRDVAELLALGDVAQQAAHDLARARLG